jgi:hypothetical protein
VEVLKGENMGMKKIKVDNIGDKIVQKAIAIILEMIYENNKVFSEDSHSNRLGRGCHTALKIVKQSWSGVPYYIEANIIKKFKRENFHILVMLLEKRIDDKIFICLINRMYAAGALGFNGWLLDQKGIIKANLLSSIFCNIYFHELDAFLFNVRKKYDKGLFPVFNKEFVEKIKLTEEEELRTSYEEKLKLFRMRKRMAEKIGLHKIIENEEFVRIKYTRYGDSFLIGIRGSLIIAKEILERVHEFMMNKLCIELHFDKTKVINSYAGKIRFLGFLISNKKDKDLPYKRSRELEKIKRVSYRLKIKRLNAKNRILKATRENIVKLLGKESEKIGVSAIELLGKKNYRETIRKLSEVVKLRLPNDNDRGLETILSPKKTYTDFEKKN